MKRRIRRLLSGIQALFSPRRISKDIHDELRQYFEAAVAARRAEGYTEAEARRVARLEVGDPAVLEDRIQDVGWETRVSHVQRDIVYAVRSLVRAPAFSISATLTLTLGIGLMTTIVSLVYSVMLRPLPHQGSDRVVWFLSAPKTTTRAANNIVSRDISVGELLELRRQATTIEAAGVYVTDFRTLTRPDGTAARLEGWRVEPDVFAVVGASPFLGRFLTSDDNLTGAVPAVVLSHAVWREHFGGDRGVVGRSVMLDEKPYTVVGVAPPAFKFPFEFGNREFWRPLKLDTETNEDRSINLPMIARLTRGSTAAQAQQEIASVLRNAGSDRAYQVTPVRDGLAAPVRPALRLLIVAAALVLLIACVNVANLLAARATARRLEFEIRHALGASRGRVLQQLLIEGLLLGAGGAAAGVGLASIGVRLLGRLGATLERLDTGQAATLPRLDELAISAPVVVTTIAMAMVAGLVCSIWPAVQASRAQRTRHAHRGSQGWHRGAGRALVLVELSLAVVLLIGAGLFVRSFARLTSVPLGYQPARVLTFQVAMPSGRYRGAAILDFAETVTAQLRRLPTVESAAYAPVLPLVNLIRNSASIRREPGAPPAADGRREDLRGVSYDYFKTMGISVTQGRGFTTGDTAGSARVVVINRTLAARDFPDENPVGQFAYLVGDPSPWRIIGVVDDVRQVALDEAPAPQVFVDCRQFPGMVGLRSLQYYAVRTSANPDALVPLIRQTLKQLEPQAAVYHAASMDALVSNSAAQPRLYAAAIGTFGGAGLGLSAVGLFGLMMYTVIGRTREIGIRTALGATRRSVIGTIVVESITLAASGIVLGIAGAIALSRYVEHLLFGVAPLDSATFVSVALTFILVAAAASYIPARRAARVDPIVALRAE
jgi:predicted permease